MHSKRSQDARLSIGGGLGGASLSELGELESSGRGVYGVIGVAGPLEVGELVSEPELGSPLREIHGVP